MRRLLAALAVLALTACISDSIGIVGTQASGIPTAPAASIAGTYTLQTVGGANLPFTMSQTGADKVELMDDAFTLTSTNSWTEVWHERRTVSGTVTVVARNDAGSFTRSPNGEISFLSPTNGTFVGTQGGNTLTLVTESLTGQLLSAVFTK
jgi:hypothetical protein